VDKILPNPWNANEQDERSFDALVDEVSETGFIDSITVVPLEGDLYRIIGGEHRWRAAKASGEEFVPCLILQGTKWKDEDLQKFVTVRMNMIKGKLNPTKFAAIYSEMATKYGKDQLQKLFGFVDKKAFAKLTRGVVEGAKRSLPKELHADLEEKAKDAKTAEDLGQIVQEMYAKYGDTMAQSFMVMTHGKQEHIYVALNTPMRKAMQKVMLFCETTQTDINAFMEPVLKECLAKAMAGLDDAAANPKESSGDGEPF
jgi:hypothetical protein